LSRITTPGYYADFDSDGFMKPNQISGAKSNIYFLGGSTTECFSMKPEERFPYLVGKYSKSNSYNGARGGNTTIHSINILLNKVRPKKPDYVVMMHNCNDVIQLINYGSLYIPAINRSVIEIHSRKYKSIIKILLPGIYEKVKEKMNSEFSDVSKDGYNYSGILNEYKNNLQIYVSTVRTIGAKPVLMTQFNRLTDNPDEDVQKHYESGPFGNLPYKDFLKLYRQANDIIRSMDCIIIDLDSLVPKTNKYMYDAVHLTPKGSEYVAGIISEIL
jgi:hypothetical protein